jgi:hypothetical protein
LTPPFILHRAPSRKPLHRELEGLAAQIVDGNVDNSAFSSLMM